MFIFVEFGQLFQCVMPEADRGQALCYFHMMVDYQEIQVELSGSSHNTHKTTAEDG